MAAQILIILFVYGSSDLYFCEVFLFVMFFILTSKYFVVKRPTSRMPKLEESCFHEVESEEGKIEALCLIARALKPKQLHIVAKAGSIPSSKTIQKYFGGCEYTIDSKLSCCVGSMDTFICL